MESRFIGSYRSVGPPTVLSKRDCGAVTPRPLGGRIVAPCSALCRTLCAGFAGAAWRHPGQRLCAALCRSAGRDEGMVISVEQRNAGRGAGATAAGDEALGGGGIKHQILALVRRAVAELADHQAVVLGPQLAGRVARIDHLDRKSVV